jgi:hypothetical protein
LNFKLNLLSVLVLSSFLDFLSFFEVFLAAMLFLLNVGLPPRGWEFELEMGGPERGVQGILCILCKTRATAQPDRMIQKLAAFTINLMQLAGASGQ